MVGIMLNASQAIERSAATDEMVILTWTPELDAALQEQCDTRTPRERNVEFFGVIETEDGAILTWRVFLDY